MTVTHMNEAERLETLKTIERYHIRSIYLFIPLTIIVVIYSTYWASIAARNQEYTEPDQWQTCFTQASFLTVPLSNINQIKTDNIRSCILDSLAPKAACNPYNGCNSSTFGCVGNTVGCMQANSPGLIPNINIPTNSLLASLSYIGNQALIFTAMGLAFFNRGLRHNSWIPSTIAFLVWCLFAVLTYYTVNPVLPVPTQTNATLLTFLQYAASKTKFNEYNESDNKCGKAFNYLWGNLFVILCVLGVLVFNLGLAIWSQFARRESVKKANFAPLERTHLPRTCAIMAMLFYLLFCVGKTVGSQTALASIMNFNYTINEAAMANLKIYFPKIWFPFAMPSLDINTVLFIAAFMGCFRGHSIQSVSAFKLAAACSLIFSLTSYPAVVGAIKFYSAQDFGHFSKCRDYFLVDTTTGFFGYPSNEQAALYCYSFRLALIGIIGLFVFMHLVCLTALHTFRKNAHRSSFSDSGNHGNLSNSGLNNPLIHEADNHHVKGQHDKNSI